MEEFRRQIDTKLQNNSRITTQFLVKHEAALRAVCKSSESDLTLTEIALLVYLDTDSIRCSVCNSTMRTNYKRSIKRALESTNVCSKECKSKLISSQRSGTKLSEEHKAKLRGGHLSEEHKAKISKTLTGKKTGPRSTPMSDEHRLNLSKSLKEFNQNNEMSDETREKLSIKSKEYHEQNRKLSAKQNKQIIEAKYGDRFDYSLADYTKRRVQLICVYDRNIVEVSVKSLLNSDINKEHCAVCEAENLYNNLKSVHIAKGHNYDYTKTIIDSKSKPFIVTCPEHGDFEKVYSKHLTQVCPECQTTETRRESNIKLLNQVEAFQDKDKFTGYEKYYDSEETLSLRSKIELTCTKHGTKTKTSINIFLNSNFIDNICTECEAENVKAALQKSFDDRKLPYTFESYDFVDKSKPFHVTCPEHGPFSKRHNKHFEQACPDCTKISYTSKPELEVLEFVRQYYPSVVHGSRSLLSYNREVDIYVPELKLCIEYDGLYWHSTAIQKDPSYHRNKTNDAEARGMRLIHIFGDEWHNKKEIVKSRLLNMLRKTPRRIYARKTEIREVDAKTAMTFLHENHIQGSLGSKHKFGLYYNDELVSLMTFGGMRKILGSKHTEGHYELLRFCNVRNTTVVGGASRLLKHFIKTVKPKHIISYACRRWSDGNLYKQLNFDFVHNSGPNYFYINTSELIAGVDVYSKESRAKHQRHKIITRYATNHNISIDDAKKILVGQTEQQIMESENYLRIYDCGTSKWSMQLTNGTT